MAPKMQKGKTNKIKPIRATVVEDPADWKKMWKTALTPPTETQIACMKHLRKCFGSWMILITAENYSNYFYIEKLNPTVMSALLPAVFSQ